MSPLVQHKRVASAAPVGPNPPGQHWAMLLFESASAGVMAIFVGFIAVLLVVGVYVILVWPLTFWDLGNLHLERFNSWVEPALWSVFGGGALAGFACFSGLAFGSSKRKAAATSPVSAGKMPQPPRYKRFSAARDVSGRARELSR